MNFYDENDSKGTIFVKKTTLTMINILKPFFELTRVQLMILAIIVITGAALRFTGANWGLPYRLHPDEWAITNDAFLIAAGKETQPEEFARPDHTNIKIDAFVFWLVDLFIPGTIEENAESHITQYYTAARSVNAFMDILSILMAFIIGSAFGKKSGIFAAGLFALSPTFIMHSHYITPETLQTLCMILTTYFMCVYLENRQLLTMVLASIAAALAYCEKYPAGYAVLFVAIGVYFAHREGEKVPLLSKVVIKRWFQAAAAFIAAILVISYTLLIRWDKIIENVTGNNPAGHLGADGLGFFGNIAYYFQTYFSHFGIILSLLTAVGIWRSFKQNRNKALLLSVGIGYIIPLSFTNLHWERWGVPFYAYLLIFAAIGAQFVLDFVKEKTQAFTEKKYWSLNGVVIAVIIVLPTLSLLLASMSTTMSFLAEDTRVVTQDLVREWGMDRSNTYYEGYSPLNPTYPATIFDRFEDMDFSRPVDAGVKYVILSSTMFERFFAEPDRYWSQVVFYNAVVNLGFIIDVASPVEDYGESAIEFIMIRNSIKTLSAYLNGGYRGPALIFVEIPNATE